MYSKSGGNSSKLTILFINYNWILNAIKWWCHNVCSHDNTRFTSLWQLYKQWCTYVWVYISAYTNINFNLQKFNILNFIVTIILNFVCYSTAMQFLIAACLHFALCFYIDYPLSIGYSGILTASCLQKVCSNVSYFDYYWLYWDDAIIYG